MRSPVRYFGGKGNIVNKLLDFIPPHEIYVEVFGGGASLLFAKEPSIVEVYNDINYGLVNFFSVLRNEEQFKKLQLLLSLTPCSRSLYNDYKTSWNEPDDIVEKAYRWFMVARQSFSGSFGLGWSSTIKDNWKGIAGSVATYLSAVDKLLDFHMRIITVQIENQDFRKIINRFDTKDTFFYLDPPYLHSTRKNKRYKNELEDKDHEELVEILTSIKGKVLISGYDNKIYQKLIDNGWYTDTINTSNFAVARTKATGVVGADKASKKYPVKETLWFNYQLNLNVCT